MSFYADAFQQVFIDLRASDLPTIYASGADNTLAQPSGYDDGQAVKDWEALVASPGYTLFADCMAAIHSHMVADAFRRQLCKGRYGTLIDIGVGGGEKLCAFLSGADEFGLDTFGFIDISETMLRHAFWRAQALANATDHPARLVPIGVDFVKDFQRLRLDSLSRTLFDDHTGAIFLFLGCTFGNYHESAMLASLASAMRPGDLLVIGVEFHELANGSTKADEDICRPYSAPEYRAWAGGIANKQLGAKNDLTDAVRVRLERPHADSQIPHGCSVLTTVPYPAGGEFRLVKSNRYSFRSFADFVETEPLKYLYSIPSPLNRFYHHVVFEAL